MIRDYRERKTLQETILDRESELGCESSTVLEQSLRWAPLLLMNHRRSRLFVPVQECEIIGRVSVGDVAPLVTPAHPVEAASAGRASSERGAVPR